MHGLVFILNVFDWLEKIKAELKSSQKTHGGEVDVLVPNCFGKVKSLLRCYIFKKYSHVFRGLVV